MEEIFLSNQTLMSFINVSNIPEDRKKELIELVPYLDEVGRKELFDMLMDFATLDYLKEKIVENYKQYIEK